MRFIYSVKYICGTQKLSTDCTPVVQGRYATEINIHNFHQPAPPGGPPVPPANIQKRILPLVLNDQTGGLEPGHANAQPLASPLASIALAADTATMDDCCNIGRAVSPPFNPNALNIGFLELVSDTLVNVTAVYTATDVTSTGGPSTGISIDVQSITPQQVP